MIWLCTVQCIQKVSAISQHIFGRNAPTRGKDYCTGFAFGNCNIQNRAACSYPRNRTLQGNQSVYRDLNRSTKETSSRHRAIQISRAEPCAWHRGIAAWACRRGGRRFEVLRCIRPRVSSGEGSEKAAVKTIRAGRMKWLYRSLVCVDLVRSDIAC